MEGGHTPGSCVIEIRNGGRTFVIAGDECYLPECLTEQIPTGASCNLQKSEEFIRKYGSGGYEVLLCHDPGVLHGRNGMKRICV